MKKPNTDLQRFLEHCARATFTPEKARHDLHKALASGEVSRAELDRAFACIWSRATNQATVGLCLQRALSESRMTVADLARAWQCAPEAVEQALGSSQPIDEHSLAHVALMVASLCQAQYAAVVETLSVALSNYATEAQGSSIAVPDLKAARRKDGRHDA